MEKLIRDGKVAIIYSPGFGAGWSTWNHEFPQCIYDPEIALTILDYELNNLRYHEDLEAEMGRKIQDIVQKKYGENFYVGSYTDLCVWWLPEGTKFVINEYDGSESIQTIEDTNWMIA